MSDTFVYIFTMTPACVLARDFAVCGKNVTKCNVGVQIGICTAIQRRIDLFLLKSNN